MAKLYIREYGAVAMNGNVPIPQETGVVDQAPITLSGSSQQSAAFGADTRIVGITGDGIFSYSVGPNPTATVNMQRVAASLSPIFIGVRGGDKVAVITNT